MRFALSDDQVAFRDAVADLLAKECPTAVVRAAWDAPDGALDRGVWDGLAAMGVLGLLVPLDHGGLGLDETYLVAILEACGRAALPHPIVETAMVAAPLLGASGAMVACCWQDRWAPHAMVADEILFRAGDQLWRVPADRAGRAPQPTVDGSRAAAELWWNPAEDPGGVAVTDDPAAVALAFDRGALGTAAVLVGLGQAMLDMTVGYVTERHQFGRPVGSFQAVKHHLADVALALEFARPAVWRAAWSTAHDEPTRARDVSMAKAMANDATELAGRHALQCHGAIGYTVEHDLHLFMKRAWALTRAWGDTAFHTERVAGALMP